MTYHMQAYSLSGSVLISGTVEDTNLRAARSTVSALLVNGPFGGMGPVGSVTIDRTTDPRGWRNATKWSTVRDYDGCEIGKVAMWRADGKSFPPNR
jgi:hypothetical protein